MSLKVRSAGRLYTPMALALAAGRGADVQLDFVVLELRFHRASGIDTMISRMIRSTYSDPRLLGGS